MRLGNFDWAGGGGGHIERRNYEHSEGRENEFETLKKLQFTVASSTFSVIAFMGLFCTCLWIACCRPKRHSRIRGRTCTLNNTAPEQMPPSQGLNPYVINPGYFSDVNLNSLNTTNGLYHPSPEILGSTKDEKPLPNSTYKPFFARVEWEPPEPPSYQSLGFSNENPGYAEVKIDPPPKSVYAENELIQEKIPTSILAICDPTKRSENQMERSPNDNVEGGAGIFQSNKEPNPLIGIGPGNNSVSSAPPESLVSIDSKDNEATLYPEGLENNTTKAGGKSGENEAMEEFTPPPFNPSYLVDQSQNNEVKQFN